MKDSGMSDSAFFRFQDKAQEKMKRFSADLDSQIDREVREKRFKQNTRPVSKKTFWQKVKEFFYVK
tara:strand:- start:684 stop:881 length:198 start_codon:yes stop_codon:yes gene_type:complete